jgi:hypothetical protein
MPLYLLSVCYPQVLQAPDAAALEVIMAEVGVWRDELVGAGKWVFGGGLFDTSSATVVREVNGDVTLVDGPFIESKEQIGGISIIEAADLDEALAWARKQSRATQTPIEVRPFMNGDTG